MNPKSLRSAVASTAPASFRSPSRRWVVRALSPWQLRAIVLAGCVLSMVLAVREADPGGYAVGDPALAKLLRGMAMIKASAVLTALIALLWRCKWPVTARVAVGYTLSVWAMIAATGLIWELTRVPLAAIIFHTALIVLLVTAWRDERPPRVVRGMRDEAKHCADQMGLPR